VFAASNFPFAFSVAGGDTASALAAGCAVVVKAHPGHPGTSERVAKLVREALPYPDLLGLVHGMQAGADLVKHPSVVAAGFTGSVAGGKAIQRLIDERETPIPFYGELGSVNPVVVLPSADAQQVATGFAASLTMGVGQFCTNPGLLFVPGGDDELRKALAEAVANTTGGPMLAERIREGYLGGLERLGQLELLAEGKAAEGAWSVTPKVFTTDLATFAAKLPAIGEECFGPASIVVTYRDVGDLPEVLERLEGSLTATVHAADPAEAEPLVDVLRRKAGRLIWNGWPTGVAVTWAMHHGGPWPATTSTTTSVGATAIDRWLEPTAYQDWPEALLPDELKDDNPLGIPRRVDGVLGR
jgi:acyl-CoA reductase-like NAD-dependent aldehyde dehydrogenase